MLLCGAPHVNYTGDVDNGTEGPTNKPRSCLGSIMLLFLAYYVVSLLATFALAYLFPWTPPVAENAPRGAVLRVTAPEGAPYEITWGTSWESQRDKVPSGDAYVDYAVPDEAVDGDRIVASVETGFLIAGRPVEDVDLGAVLFVNGEYADCNGGSGSVDIDWSTYDGQGFALTRTTCGTHRWGGLFPDPLSWVGL